MDDLIKTEYVEGSDVEKVKRMFIDVKITQEYNNQKLTYDTTFLLGDTNVKNNNQGCE